MFIPEVEIGLLIARQRQEHLRQLVTPFPITASGTGLRDRIARVLIGLGTWIRSGPPTSGPESGGLQIQP